MGLRRQTLAVGLEFEARKGKKAKTNVDSLDPFGSLIDRKCSPLPTYAGVLAQRCADRCYSRADKQDKTSDIDYGGSHRC